jgi:hypothetical protein
MISNSIVPTPLGFSVIELNIGTDTFHFNSNYGLQQIAGLLEN